MRAGCAGRIIDHRPRRTGLTNTFEKADILGVSAFRNGTWIPAMANSLVHTDFKGVWDALNHLDTAAQDLYTSLCDKDNKSCQQGLWGMQTCETTASRPPLIVLPLDAQV